MNVVKNKKVVLGIVLGLFILILITAGGFFDTMYVIGAFTVLFGLVRLAYTFIRRRDKRKSIGILFAGILMFSFANEYGDFDSPSPTVEVKPSVAEQEIEAKEKAEQLALQKEQEEQEKKEEAEKQARQLKDIESALELAESEPTRENYDKAFTLISSLTQENESFADRLTKVEETVKIEEEKILAVEAALEKAEQEETRSAVEEAEVLTAGLVVQNDALNSRLQQTKTVVEEKERVAAEEERQALIAAEKKEEKQAAKKSEESKAAQKSQAQTQPKQSEKISNVVYVAPDSGSKYHYSANCRGLNNANSVVEMSLSSAQSQGYDLCGWED
ncbi:MAG: hypothetical protein ABS913_06715 [Desemzia incerta]|uniref:DUF308 domain-containing protein n=1 Tax=Desemzia incerta TaxID=82801 RepID=UPI003315F2EF